ncbi:hypothetical protein [uncultured Jannaschia sp.]|uniref:hypothetical protein n=1 Tax=uncultured Jannaschia sp. TaxID=293347 RepID=UPI0026132AC7|nr:hypothetical protein [uncultured Jannaschia sp.]
MAERMPEGDEFVILGHAPAGTRWSGDAWVDDDAVNMAFERSRARRRVDIAIGQFRRRHITVIDGQEGGYLSKEAEAKAYVAMDPEPADLADFPLLAAELGRATPTAPTPYQLAQLWLNMAAIWRPLFGATEALRLDANDAIQAAATKAEIDIGLANLTAQLDAL